MIRSVLATTAIELRILSRNRWVAVAVLLMIGFSLLIAFAGSAPVGTLGTDRLTVTAASLTTLVVYLVPLIALLISYDAIAGEASRGTLSLLLTYPASRQALLVGKFLAQLTVLSVAVLAGLGAATLLLAAVGDVSTTGMAHVARLFWSACLLGATFLAIGNCISASTREPGTAAAIAIALWVAAVVMYDVALLAALVADDGGLFTRQLFPWLLVASPTDAFRLLNLSEIDAGAVYGGVGGNTDAIGFPRVMPAVSLVVWPAMAAVLAAILLRRYQP